MPVLRIENDIAAFTAVQRSQVVRAVTEALELTGGKAVQIDFDVPQSARGWYLDALRDIRRSIGPGVFLSITAHVSWCEAPNSWLAKAPVDEIVPMFFNMGPAHQGILGRLAAGGETVFPGCRSSAGLTVQEPPMKLKAKRLYLFPSWFAAWTPNSVVQAFGRFQR
jgi:hypothetical protein